LLWHARYAARKDGEAFSDGGEPVFAFRDHKGAVRSVLFDAGRILSGSADHTSILRDTATGDILYKFATTGGVTKQILQQDRVFQAADNGVVKLWNSKLGTADRVFGTRSAATIGLSATETELYVANEDGVHIYDISTGAERLSIKLRGLKGFYADHVKHSVVTATELGVLFRWDTNTGKRLGTYAVQPAVKDHRLTSFDCDGQTVVAGHETGEVSLWHMENLQPVGVCKGHSGPVRGIHVAGDHLVSCSTDNTVRVWNSTSCSQKYALMGGTARRRLDSNAGPSDPEDVGVAQVKFDESRIAARIRDMIRVYDFEVLSKQEEDL